LGREGRRERERERKSERIRKRVREREGWVIRVHAYMLTHEFMIL
jgi:hypothetical protein